VIIESYMNKYRDCWKCGIYCKNLSSKSSHDEENSDNQIILINKKLQSIVFYVLNKFSMSLFSTV
ncbi:hypothetical protein CD118_11725, partial [Staphylococcus coagulans]